MALDNYTREISFEDADILALINERGALVTEGRELSKQAEELVKQHEELVTRITAQAERITELKRTILARTKVAAEHLMGEFELPVTTDIKDDKVVLIVTDAMAEFKSKFDGFDRFKFFDPAKVGTREDLADNG